MLVFLARELQTLRHQIVKVHSHLVQESCLFVDNVDAFLPDSGAALYTTELARKQRVETVKMVLGPFDAGARHDRGEALLVDADCVLDKGEVDERDLEYV